MLKQMYLIHDKVANVFSSIFLADTDKEAARMVLEAAQNQQTQLFKYPDDYALCKIGSVDIKKGLAQGLSMHEYVLTSLRTAESTSLKTVQSESELQ